MKKIILLSAFILTIAFGLCGCKKDDATVHFASETEQTAVVSSDVNRLLIPRRRKLHPMENRSRRQKTQEMTLMNLLSGASISVVRLPIPVYTE